jgi:hypothetical protein
MKQILFSLLVVLTFSLNAQKVEKATMPAKTSGDIMKAQDIKNSPLTVPTTADGQVKTNAIMTFESLTVDYGTVDYGSEPLRTIKFTNTGTDPLVILNARGSCGCTVPTWPKEPIAPGQSSVIEIRYDTNRPGRISKSVTISTNEGTDTHVLQVVGEIMAQKEEKAVPASEPNIIKGN